MHTSTSIGPEWFVEACEHAPQPGQVVVEGCRVRYLSWKPDTVSGAPLLLLHGSTAHAHWWSHLAPILARDRHVVAMDVSGHGDSDHRPGYALDLWADEMLAVAAEIDPHDRGLFVVGHSLGGHIATAAAARREHRLRGLVVCETVTERRQRDPGERPASGRKRSYPSVEDALGRFRLTPPQSGSLPFIVDRVARQSLREQEGGWTWKFDPGFMTGSPRSHRGLLDFIAQVPCRVACVYAQHGLVTRDAANRLAAASPRPMAVVELPLAGHHPMLDQPLALVAAINGIVAVWEAAGAR
jgi:pimeloyl-ACP methyl ester carboxylesterase